MVAALEDNEDAVETLLLAGADPRVADRDGKTALDHAKDEENDAVVEILELALSH
jgi:ankyrin repeat protein